ncbi:MAG: hypothetical protein NT069_32850, partial [Planctomycetota bacterium]|nr:hypothetical protein [Planctomycetota bacterium]
MTQAAPIDDRKQINAVEILRHFYALMLCLVRVLPNSPEKSDVLRAVLNACKAALGAIQYELVPETNPEATLTIDPQPRQMKP